MTVHFVLLLVRSKTPPDNENIIKRWWWWSLPRNNPFNWATYSVHLAEETTWQVMHVFNKNKYTSKNMTLLAVINCSSVS